MVNRQGDSKLVAATDAALVHLLPAGAGQELALAEFGENARELLTVIPHHQEVRYNIREQDPELVPTSIHFSDDYNQSFVVTAINMNVTPMTATDLTFCPYSVSAGLDRKDGYWNPFTVVTRPHVDADLSTSLDTELVAERTDQASVFYRSDCHTTLHLFQSRVGSLPDFDGDGSLFVDAAISPDGRIAVAITDNGDVMVRDISTQLPAVRAKALESALQTDGVALEVLRVDEELNHAGERIQNAFFRAAQIGTICSTVGLAGLIPANAPLEQTIPAAIGTGMLGGAIVRQLEQQRREMKRDFEEYAQIQLEKALESTAESAAQFSRSIDEAKSKRHR